MFGLKDMRSGSLNDVTGGKSPNKDDWGNQTPEVNSHVQRKFSDFDAAVNHAKSKRKESNITEEVLEDEEEDWEDTDI